MWGSPYTWGSGRWSKSPGEKDKDLNRSPRKEGFQPTICLQRLPLYLHSKCSSGSGSRGSEGEGSAKLNLPGMVKRGTGPESGSSDPGPASSHHSSTVWASAGHVLQGLRWDRRCFVWATQAYPTCWQCSRKRFGGLYWTCLRWVFELLKRQELYELEEDGWLANFCLGQLGG